MPTVTCLRLSHVSVICRVTYFQFPIQSAFLQYIGRQAAPALRRTIGFNTQYRGLPKRQKTCSTSTLATGSASLERSGNASAHLVNASTHVRM